VFINVKKVAVVRNQSKYEESADDQEDQQENSIVRVISSFKFQVSLVLKRVAKPLW